MAEPQPNSKLGAVECITQAYPQRLNILDQENALKIDRTRDLVVEALEDGDPVA